MARQFGVVGHFKNTSIPEPQPPGPWVDPVKCVCGEHRETYKDFNSHVSFAEAEKELQSINRSTGVGNPYEGMTYQESTGGYRSRGPVLWMMHVMKLERWYAKHEHCPEEITNYDWEEFCDEYPGSESCEGLDEWIAAGRPSPGEDPDVDQRIEDARAFHDEEEEIPF